MESVIQNVNIEKIIPNRFQPRLSFDEKALNDLAESIKEHGIIQPLIVRRVGEKFEIIAGERRYKAATIAGLSEVPVIISNLDDSKSAEVAVVENVQRKNLSSIEEAKSYKKLLDRGNLSQEQLAQKLGMSQPAIANKLRLLNLTPEVQEALLNEKISERHARSLLQIIDPVEQTDMLKRIIDERLTVRQLDEEIKKLLDKTPQNGRPSLDINPDEVKAKSEDIVPKNNNDNIFNLFGNNNYPSLEDQTVNLETNPNDEFNPYNKESSTEEMEELDVPVEENVAASVKENTPIVKEEKPTGIIPNDIDSVKKAYEDLENQVSDAGFKIVSEDFDFNELYQIIIKIEKAS
jgi:ParB family transcriptional regulator, chromosome partitioning protein